MTRREAEVHIEMTTDNASLAELFEDTPKSCTGRPSLIPPGWRAGSESYGRLAFLGDSVLGLSARRHPLRGASGRRYRRAHQDPQPGGQRPYLRGGRPRARLRGALRRARARGGRGASGRDAARIRANAGLGLRGGDRRRYLAHGFERSSEAVVEAFTGRSSRRRASGSTSSPSSRRLARDGETVTYEVVRRGGPPHDRRFEIRATVDGDEIGSGSGRSKKEAEQAAAQRALEKLRS